MTLDARVAAVAAEETPGVDPEQLVARLDAIARSVRMPTRCAVHEAIARLNLELFHTRGFRGDLEDYSNVRNSLLDQVLERRVGLPLLLCTIYIEVARRLEVEVRGVGFPGHFLVIAGSGPDGFYVDPFNEGRILRRALLEARLRTLFSRYPSPAEVEQALRPVDDDAIMVRLNNNLKGAMLRVDDIAGAARAVRRMLVIQPHLVDERIDLALMLDHLGRRSEAIDDLVGYLRTHGSRPGSEPLAELLSELTGSD